MILLNLAKNENVTVKLVLDEKGKKRKDKYGVLVKQKGKKKKK